MVMALRKRVMRILKETTGAISVFCWIILGSYTLLWRRGLLRTLPIW